MAALVYRFLLLSGQNAKCSGDRENPAPVASITWRNAAMSENVMPVRRFSQATQLLAPISPTPVLMMRGRRGLRNKKFSAVMSRIFGAAISRWGDGRRSC